MKVGYKIKKCKCGCGKWIIYKNHHKYDGIPNYLTGHNKVSSYLKGKTFKEYFGKKKAKEIIQKREKNRMETYKNNPSLKENISNKLKEFYKNNPNVKQEKSNKMKKLWRDKPETFANAAKAASIANKGKIPWSSGLTKETDERIRKASEKRSKIKKRPDLWKRKNEIINKHLSGKSTVYLAKELKCVPSTIWGILKREGILVKERYDVKLKTNEIISLYKQGISMEEIRGVMKCSRPLIDKILRENNIPIRNGGEHWKGKENIRRIRLPKKEVISLYETKSPMQISKLFNCSITVIYRILKENQVEQKEKGYFLKTPYDERFGNEKSELIKKKIKKARAKQIFPMKDTKIELKIQDFLTLLKIEFVTHKYMKIKHGYQCDILIPVQEGINQKTIIECDGDFFHCNPNKYSADFVRFKNSKKLRTAKEIWERDDIRTKQLLEKGFKVLRIWEGEINKMELNDFKNKLNNLQK